MTADLLAGLDDGQRAAVLAPSGPVCVLAGAGTGKTRTITHRIAHLVARGAHPVSEILAVTFTTRAAGEMRVRLRGLGVPGVQARTFHSAALKQLKYFWPRAVGGTLWPVVDQKMRLVAVAARRSGADTDTATLRDLASEIEWSKASLIAPTEYLAEAARHHRDASVPADTVAKVFAAYERVKNDAEQLDFDDLLLHTCAALESDEAVAREFRARYRCFVVDEYQDVTPLQQRLLDAWLGGRDQLTVVGDANQTIYSFAGASPGYLLGFDRRYGEATVVRLERDYRSTPQVVGLANRVIAGAGGAGARLRLRLTAALPDGPPVSYTEHPDEPTEAKEVARQVAVLVEGGLPATSIAVLYRINAQSEAFETALADAGVAAVVRGAERFFNRAEVRQAIGVLRTAAASASTGSASAEPGGRADGAQAGSAGPGSAERGSAEPRSAEPGSADGAQPGSVEPGSVEPGSAEPGSVEPGSAEPASVEPASVEPGSGPGLVDQVRALLERAGLTAEPPPAGALRERWDNLLRLVGVAAELADADPRAGLPALVAELDHRAEAQHAPTADGVTLTSLHAAKGLEWDAVFLVGLADGTVPIQHAQTPEEVEEERRLLYVGVTRARTRLALSWALSRTEGGRKGRRRSRFLTGIAPDAPVTGGARRSPGRCRMCGGPLSTPEAIKLGRCAACPTTADPALVEALRAWRRSRSAEDSVPAFVVFSDATLLAIAERRPADDAALLAIPGIGRTKLDTYGREVLGIVTRTR